MQSKTCLPTYNLVSVLFSACKCQLLLKYPRFWQLPMSQKLMTFKKNDVFLIFKKATLHPKVIRTPFKCISPGYLKISCPFVTNIFILFSIQLAIQVATFYKSYRCRAKFFRLESLPRQSLLHQAEYFASVDL